MSPYIRTLPNQQGFIVYNDEFIKAEHHPPIKYKKHNVECDGNGLLFNSHHRADLATIARALAAKVPTNTSSKGISKKDSQPQSSQYTKGWWIAQVFLCGLQQRGKGISGCKATLTAAIEKGLGVSEHMKEEEGKFGENISIDGCGMAGGKRKTGSKVHCSDKRGQNPTLI
jgi:hypothetical protein